MFHLPNQLYIQIHFAYISAWGKLLIGAEPRIRRYVFTLHKCILSICYSFVYVCEEASQLFTGLHASSHDDQQGIRADMLTFSVWRAVKTCEDLSRLFTLITICVNDCYMHFVKSEDLLPFSIFPDPEWSKKWRYVRGAFYISALAH